MSIPIVINGVSTLVPGVYATLTVENSLPTVAPAGRSVLILGEAVEGVPGSELDLTKNFFTNFDDVVQFYRSGPIVDAARMLFQNQPSVVFPGQVDRLYVYKTNNSTRASKSVSSPSGYGTIASLTYGERGNQIRSQIRTSQNEVKPTRTVNYLPSPAARSFKVSVNGAVTGSLAVSAHGLASDFVTALAGVTGLTTSGGAARTVVTSGPMTINATVSNDLLTITRSTGTATFDTSSIQVGDSAYIQAGATLPVAGASDQNAGSYLVQSVTSASLVLKQIKKTSSTAEILPVAMVALTAEALANSDIKINAPVTLTVTGTTPTGAGASLEILENGGSDLILGMLHRDSSFANTLADSTSSIARISATVPAAGKLTVSLDVGSWAVQPKVGDVVRIQRGSLLSGGQANVGLYVVESSAPRSLTISRAFSGITTAAVSSTPLNGANDTLLAAASFVTTSVATRRLDSAQERKVRLDAVRTTTGEAFPSLAVGGASVLELSFYDVAATAATVSIDSLRKLTLDLTGTGLSDVTVNTKKYATIKDLVDYLNTVPGLSARAGAPIFNSLPTAALDMVTSVGILSGSSLPAYNGKVLKDYYDWKQLFANNAVLVTFIEGGMSLKAGLPAAESVPAFLTGGTVGGTSNASIQSGLDDGLKVTVRQVVPLFSRDSALDINDGLTDESSEYTIDSIHAAVKGHVATASAPLRRKERYGLLSFDGTFAEAKEKSGLDSYERNQMFFQRVRAAGADGTVSLKLPYMAACAIAAGRSQAILGTSMLRKPFLLSGVEHTGLPSLFDTSLLPDFSPDDNTQLNEAIEAGLFTLREVTGFGIRGESPDLSTRSRVNDPQAWFYERINVGFVADEVLDACRTTLENFIGSRTTDVSTAVVGKSLSDTLSTFVGSSLLSFEVLKVESLGNQYTAKVKITPVEALEAIVLSVEAARSEG